MPKIAEAVSDGEVLRLVERVEFEPNTRVRLTLEVMDAASKPPSFFQTARSLLFSSRAGRLVCSPNCCEGERR